MKCQRPAIANYHCRHARTFLLVTTQAIVLLLLAVSTTPTAWAQTFSVLHSFDGEAGGESPYAGVTIGPRGSLYGTTHESLGGYGAGIAYELQPHGSGWVFQVLDTFRSYNAGLPWAGLVFGPRGELYGAAYSTIYSLQMPLTAFCRSLSCPWHEEQLAYFNGSAGPGYGNVIFDAAGNMYDTILDGGTNRDGSVVELTGSGNQWTVTTLYSFGQGTNDGRGPFGNVVFDVAGHMFGTTSDGGANNDGTIYELVPADGGWNEIVLYNFDRNTSGAAPYDTLAIDASGNLYGTTVYGGVNGAGTTFELSPAGGTWRFSLLYSFNACTSYAAVTLDSAGNVYGTCSHGGAYGAGMLYKLANSGGTWNLSDLHDFSDGTDGGYPEGGVVLDSSGNFFGTAEAGGTSNSGTVWELASDSGNDSETKKP